MNVLRVSAGTHGDQKRTLDAQELDLQAVVSLPRWVLETKLSFTKQ